LSPISPGCSTVFSVRNYNLAATLDSGQAFRWRQDGAAWVGIVAGRWVRLRVEGDSLFAETAEASADWAWLSHYLQTELDFEAAVRTFPVDAPMTRAVAACAGLRLLRQDPWECLASFILSSTKQITQIRQIVELLCSRYGPPVSVPPGCPPMFGFPSISVIAGLPEAELRACKMGFRAPYLKLAAQAITRGEVDLERIAALGVAAARAELMKLHGVGRKIADCVLLFAYGFQSAFPVDVWILKALRDLYFPGRKVGLKRLHQFANTHFGPHGGMAQQYLFHYMRTAVPRERLRRPAGRASNRRSGAG
jgi:N-glycosylase/DNA lyase